MCFAVELSKAQPFLAATRPGDTPVPIPNTTVKARTAEGTAHSRGRIGGRQDQKENGFIRDPSA